MNISSDPADILTELTFIERIDKNDALNTLEYVNNHMDELVYPQSTQAFIVSLIENSEDENTILNKVTYTNFNNMNGSEIRVPGRIKCSNNSVFKMQRKIRNSLITNNYIDVDMVNCQCNILRNILDIYLPNYKNENKYKFIDEFIYNRDNIISEMKYLFSYTDGNELTKLECKQFIFGIMYTYPNMIFVSKYNNDNEQLIELINLINYKLFPSFFIRWFDKSKNITFNYNNVNNYEYAMRMKDFIILMNNISYSIKNIQTFVITLHEFGVTPTATNKPYSIYKEITNESHSYVSYLNKHNDNTLTVIPKAIPPFIVSNIYFYLYNTSKRQQIRYKCFDQRNVVYKINNKLYYDTDKFEECYNNLNVVFRLIMYEYEKTILYHCITYTMNKHGIKNNLHAILCHDGFMLDLQYFDKNLLNYDTYLCDIKDYVYKQMGLNMDFEYKIHCDEIIPDLENNCNEVYKNISGKKCPDNIDYSDNNVFNENQKYIPKTKKEIAQLTNKYYKNPINDNEYKLYYNTDHYYKYEDNIPTPLDN